MSMRTIKIIKWQVTLSRAELIKALAAYFEACSPTVFRSYMTFRYRTGHMHTIPYPTSSVQHGSGTVLAVLGCLNGLIYTVTFGRVGSYSEYNISVLETTHQEL